MSELSALQRRVLLSALSNQGHIILWVLGNGKWNLPGFSEDVGSAARALENAGFLVSRDRIRCGPSLPQPRSAGSYVFELTENGWKEARAATGRDEHAL
jgi:hypothetical protein